MLKKLFLSALLLGNIYLCVGVSQLKEYGYLMRLYDNLATRQVLGLLVDSKTAGNKSQHWRERIAAAGAVVSTYGHRKSDDFDVKSQFTLININGDGDQSLEGSDEVTVNSEHIITSGLGLGLGAMLSDSKRLSDAFVKCSVKTLINCDNTEKNILACSGSLPRPFLEWALDKPELLKLLRQEDGTEELVEISQ